MIVSLLISAVCIETDEKTASEKASASVVSSARQDEFLKEEKKPVDGHDEGSSVQKRQSSKHAKYSDDQDPRSRRGSVRSTEHKALRSVDSNLANKMAKEALKSSKMQETMRKLTRISKPHGPLYASVKMPSPSKSKKIHNEHKQDARKGHRKLKGKRYLQDDPASKYELVDDWYDHLDPIYPARGEEVLDQPLTPEQDSLNARGDFSDEIQQQNPDDYSNQEIQQPRTENAKASNMVEDAEVPSYPDEEAMKSIQAQGTNNLPQSYASNAISQPFGKVLESLGISVSMEPSKSNQNANLENVSPATNDQLPSDNFEERVLSPSYLKQEAKEEMNGGKWNSRRTAQSRIVNKDGHSRRQSNTFENEYSTYTDDPLAPASNMNITVAMQDTKEIANHILNTIMEELEELKLDRSKDNKKDGLPCRLSGSWSSARTGMKLDMKVLNRSIVVRVFELTTIQFRASPLNGTWNVSGYAPFKRGAPFTLIATDNTTKSLAVFIGACKVCEGIDTISGVWSVAQQPKDCKDFLVSTTVFNDVFRKTTLSALKENQNTARLQNTNRTESTTL